MGGLLYLVQRGGAGARPSPLLAVPKCNSPPINGQCTNFILFDVAILETCESEIAVRIESRIESAATIRVESRIESADSRLQLQC